MSTAIITGGSSGLGKAISEQLKSNGWRVVNWSLDKGVDVSNELSVRGAAAKIYQEKWDVLINCAGVNHIEYIPELEEADWDRLLNTNAKGIFLTTKHLCDWMKGGTILNIVSNASHIPMTNSLAYNASKGAAEIMTRQMARELSKTHNITVFGISPNKLKGTGMSKYIDDRVPELRGWTKEEAQKYQLASLPAGEETDPETLAEFIGFLLSSKQRHKFLQGCILPYGA